MEIKLDSPAILKARGPKNPVLSNRPYHFLLEQERSTSGEIDNVATVFLSNRECPFRCLMCDLWKNTTDESVSGDDILEQVNFALDRLKEEESNDCRISTWKLYNSGNFFDRKAIPASAVSAICQLANRFREQESLDRLIVECHPKLVGESCFKFSQELLPQLEVAMGLETIHPGILPKLNKQMTLDDFERSTELLLKSGIDVRAFILLRTPWMTEQEGIDWALRSVEWAFGIGVQCCAVIPTRKGNGILDRLENLREFAEPKLGSLERVQQEGLDLVAENRRLFVDDWDAHRFSSCSNCADDRVRRIQKINRIQKLLPEVQCPQCD